METFDDEAKAVDYMKRKNKSIKSNDVYVIVEGPDDGEWTVMTQREAVEYGFSYRWEA